MRIPSRPRIASHLPRQAMRLTLIGVLAIVAVTGAKLYSVLDKLQEIERVAAVNVLLGAQSADIREIGALSAQIATLPQTAPAREVAIERLDSAWGRATSRSEAIVADMTGLPVFPGKPALDDDVGRLAALSAMLRTPAPGLPTADIAGQIDDLAQVRLPQSIQSWQAVLSTHASAIRRQVDWSLALFSVAILSIVGLLWMMVLRPLSRIVADGDVHARALETALQHSAGHDRLTGLPNRRHAGALLDAVTARRRKVGIGLMHIDLGQFRAVNEELGHEAGDIVLQETARRLTMRAKGRSFAARVGGDEFVLLADNVTSQEELEDIARAVRADLRAPIELPSGPRRVDCAIGAVWSDETNGDPRRLSVQADIALHAAVNGSDGPVRLFTAAMRDDVARREALGRDLRRAVASDEMVMYFQPQICARTGAIAGFEALLRWQHPARGILPPGQFLDLAEEIGLADDIGATVLAQALDAWMGWKAAGFEVPHVAVNYSAAQLADPQLADRIKWAVDGRDLSPSCLALEVVETVAVDSETALAVRTIRALADAGFDIELDDFGTGHASIANIRRFGARRIKIDRSFVSGIDTRDDLSAMADAMVRMAKALDVGTIAEGVETAEERAAVIALGCDAIQGFNVARPMPFEDSLIWLAEHRVLTRGSARNLRRSA